MDGLFSTVRFFFGCGTLLILALVVLAHLPRSPLRSALVQICGWATAAICGAYVLSPIDVMPEMFLGPLGLVDDLVAIVVGVMSAISALNAAAETHPKKESNDKRNAA